MGWMSLCCGETTAVCPSGIRTSVFPPPQFYQLICVVKSVRTWIVVAAYGQGHRVCYFTNSAQYRPEGGKFFPEDIDPSLCNYLVYHKAVIDNDCLMATFEWNDEDLWVSFSLSSHF